MSVWTRVFGKTRTKPTEVPRGASKPPSKYDPRWDPPGSEHLEGSIVDSDTELVRNLKIWIAQANAPKRSGEWTGGCEIPGDIADTTLHQLVRASRLISYCSQLHLFTVTIGFCISGKAEATSPRG
jgi:hypothetical protein